MYGFLRRLKSRWTSRSSPRQADTAKVEIDPALYDILPKGQFVFGPATQYLLVRKNRYRVTLRPGEDVSAEYGVGWLTEDNSPGGYDLLWGDEANLAAFLAEGHGVRERMPAEIMDAAGEAVTRARSIIDIGCGVGDLLMEARKRNSSAALFGCDFAQKAVERTRAVLPDADIRQLHVETTLSYETGRFDLVLCTDVLEHMEHPDAIVTELVRICAPGGTVIVVVPDGDVDSFLGHLWFWSEDSFRKFLSKWSATVWRLQDCREFIGLIRPQNAAPLASNKSPA